MLMTSGGIHCRTWWSTFYEHTYWSSHCWSCSHRSWCCLWTRPDAQNTREGLSILILEFFSHRSLIFLGYKLLKPDSILSHVLCYLWQVPFRLTRDIIDGMGVTGVEGVFRRCCEETLSVMRTNKEALLTIVEVCFFRIISHFIRKKKSILFTDHMWTLYRSLSMIPYISGLSLHWRLCSVKRYSTVLGFLFHYKC